MPTTKEADNIPLRRSSRIAATDSPVLNQRVLTRRASSSEPLETSASPIVIGRLTRAKRLSLSEEKHDEDAGEGTPKRFTRGALNPLRMLSTMYVVVISLLPTMQLETVLFMDLFNHVNNACLWHFFFKTFLVT